MLEKTSQAELEKLLGNFVAMDIVLEDRGWLRYQDLEWQNVEIGVYSLDKRYFR